MFLALVLILSCFVGDSVASESSTKIIKVPSGQFSPLFGLDVLQKSFDIHSFKVDENLVTNSQFSKFLRAHPDWTKRKVFPLYVDARYLESWNSDFGFKGGADAPVTLVSWYAAGAYCEAKNGRLLTTLEWEYLAAASEDEADATKTASFNQSLLELYSKPQVDVSRVTVRTLKSNYYGVKNMHGLIWEWTQDFNSFFIASDNRSDGDKSKNLFCGAGAIGAKEKENYAAFIRYAFRGSLQARYSTKNLGFRCAYSI